MRFGRLGSFCIGVVVTAASIGAVSFVSASSDSTITACAHKTTGAMRLLKKGNCKRSEVRLTWNQQGLQGPEGPQGVQGESGPQGVKGDSGTAPDTAIYARKADVVPRTLTTQPLQTTPIPEGTNPTVLVPAEGTPPVDGRALLGMAARSYTTRYDIPANWRGRIEGNCPDDAPVPLSYGVYALDDQGVRIGDYGWPPYGAYSPVSRAQISFTASGSPAFTLFVTQTCGPITTAVAE
jgi:hypothetical protein